MNLSAGCCSWFYRKKSKSGCTIGRCDSLLSYDHCHHPKVIGRTVCGASASSSLVCFFMNEQTVCTADKAHHAMTCSSRREDSPPWYQQCTVIQELVAFSQYGCRWQPNIIIIIVSVCTHARECECAHARTSCAHARVCVCVCAHMHQSARACAWVCVCVCVHVRARAWVSACMYVSVCVCVCVCARARTHIRVLWYNVI